MEFPKQLLKEMLTAYFETSFSKLLPQAISDALNRNDLLICQNFVSIDEAIRRYNLCRKTLYNYHNKGYITLHSSEGKTFVPINELEAHIRKHPLPRNIGMKVAA
jgi:ACT domain-containing protein